MSRHDGTDQRTSREAAPRKAGISRRSFLRGASGAALLTAFDPLGTLALAADPPKKSTLFTVKAIPNNPFWGGGGGSYHAGLDTLLGMMGEQGLPFYRSPTTGPVSGPGGLIAADDVVLIKVNAQWKYRGCTNSDVVRGLIRRLLDHPDGFTGEVVIVENGQGRGSLRCNTSQSYEGDTSVQANANNHLHSFVWLAERLFKDPRVSTRLLDPIRQTFIAADDHVTEGFRRFENVSYPCFTTPNGRRVELKEGIWMGTGYARRKLKLINVPVLKHHDETGSEITASLKHFYGLVSMADGHSSERHYSHLGATCGTMVAAVRTPVLNILDCIWVSQSSLLGLPPDHTTRVNRLVAGQDPVALDWWAAKNVLYPIDNNPRHHPNFPGIRAWLVEARDTINARGGLWHPAQGIYAGQARMSGSLIDVFSADAGSSFPW